ncbi:transferrin-binding protein-like solute binding protein [Sphingopyxis sp. CCNWLW253]|uniref:transferrin-binding protein-like solute binding protein n=1 Tax=unclassified Sphingopyxis TaxID=2614943 RepID=UPI003012B666
MQYADPFAFDRERFFESALVEVRYEEVYDDNSPRFYSFVSSTGRINTAPGAAVLTWHPEKSGSVRLDNVTTSYDSTSLTAQTADGFRFIRTMPSEQHIYGWGRSSQLRNVAVAYQEKRWAGFFDNGPRRGIETTQYFLAGQRTPATDMPTAGVLSYQGASSSSRSDPIVLGRDSRWYLSGQQTLSVDLTTGRATGSWTANNGLRFELNGVVQGDNSLRINGTMAAADGSFSGRFIGFFYGPQAREVGILFLLESHNFATDGFFVGARR